MQCVFAWQMLLCCIICCYVLDWRRRRRFITACTDTKQCGWRVLHSDWWTVCRTRLCNARVCLQNTSHLQATSGVYCSTCSSCFVALHGGLFLAPRCSLSLAFAVNFAQRASSKDEGLFRNSLWWCLHHCTVVTITWKRCKLIICWQHCCVRIGCLTMCVKFLIKFQAVSEKAAKNCRGLKVFIAWKC